MADVFFDTNVLIYLMSGRTRAVRARELLHGGGVVSVQVLNEFVSVARRKLAVEWDEVREILATVHRTCSITPLLLGTHERGLAIAERYGFHIYDSMILAAALEAGCTTLFSEDMQDGQRIGRLDIRNPFA